MKKFFKYYLMAMAAVLTVSLASCSNDDELLDIDDDEEEYVLQVVDDIDVSVIYHALTENRDAYVPEKNTIEYCFAHSPKVRMSEDRMTDFLVGASVKDIQPYGPLYLMSVVTSKKINDLKAGDVINPELISFDNTISSYKGPHTNFVLKGSITVAEISESTVTLKFDNVIIEEVYTDTGLTHCEMQLNGLIPYEKN